MTKASDVLRFPRLEIPENVKQLRLEVREFVREEISSGRVKPTIDSWLSGYDPDFSRKLGTKSWLGMTLPESVGGHGKTMLERFVVQEELLAAGAPVSAHWIADRQTAPLLTACGNDTIKDTFLPGIINGEIYFAIGLSEPDAGSDLAAVRTQATRTSGGWLLNGTKIWSSGAHHCQAMVVLCRTSPADGRNRHVGLSQLIVKLDQPGVTVRPIHLLTGAHHFNEVVFDNVEVSDDMLLGSEGEGWAQVMSELALERSGAERFLSTFPLFVQLVERAKGCDDLRVSQAIGQLTARLYALHNMSLRVVSMISRGEPANVEAVLIKDIGTRFERILTETARLVMPPTDDGNDEYSQFMRQAVLHSPGFTLRGGTNEILRGMVARGLGLR